MTTATHTTEATDWGLTHLYESLAAQHDSELMGLLGAVMYVGEMSIQSTLAGKHFYFYAPNRRTYLGMKSKAVKLYQELEKVFPISRLYLCTVEDPIATIPATYWSSKSFMPHPPHFLGFGSVDKHDWFVVCKLDEDGRLVSQQPVHCKVTKREGVRKRK